MRELLKAVVDIVEAGLQEDLRQATVTAAITEEVHAAAAGYLYGQYCVGRHNGGGTRRVHNFWVEPNDQQVQVTSDLFKLYCQAVANRWTATRALELWARTWR